MNLVDKLRILLNIYQIKNVTLRSSMAMYNLKSAAMRLSLLSVFACLSDYPLVKAMR